MKGHKANGEDEIDLFVCYSQKMNMLLSIINQSS